MDRARLLVRQVADGVDESRSDPADRGQQPLGLVGPAQVGDPDVGGEVAAQRLRDDVERGESQ